ncbi:PepSY domain-containing protein [Flagellimonas pelagia]|uniref:PepSY domain-containing protein n=1 Tax=Flagellimonas pelagia TaxID=2306998 RepID=A0A3A1NGK0_9FLAO|nr:PepSY domain-containing protein [Allomuricauda maritima]RIV44232.1 hypothetical protein D2V05_12190 [Allomuricauda maritima]TXJ94149.1 hypothetical protein FQ017_12080 [Allomuricauda maritima]
MVKRSTAIKIRKAHRYLGLFLGIQFILWTASGLYFSWTDIDEIHGDHFRNTHHEPMAFDGLIGLSQINLPVNISTLNLKEIANRPYYWINNEFLVDARTGKLKKGITEEEALQVAKKQMAAHLKVKSVDVITATDKHHEYREKRLPAYVITYDSPENIKAYVSVSDGSFQTIRHRNWRWFDFLWMTHTMDYEGRDDINNIVLRAFSLLGLITVLSGFLLWFTSSPTARKWVQRKNN